METPVTFNQYAMKFRTLDSYTSADYYLGNSLNHLWDIVHTQEPLIYIQGPKASGKTHISHIFCEIHGGFLLAGADFTSLEQIGNTKALALDDCDAVTSADLLFHTINHCKEQQIALLLTSTASIAQFPHQLPDLTSRLRAGIYVEIPQPDDMLIRGILLKRLADHQMRFQTEVLDYLVNRIPRDYSFLDLLFEEMIAAVSQHPRHLTLPLMREVLHKLNIA